MKMIVAVDENWAIGYRGDLLVKIPADQQYFRNETMGKVIVMGRKTLESFPNGIPLAGRTNIVLSKKKDYRVKGATIVSSVEETLELLKQYNSDDVYIIGGESIYRAFLPYVETIYVTKIDYAYEADTYFPDLTKEKEWRLTMESEEQTYFNLEYYFQVYERTI